ncbi:MAG TPA: tetratricopeptide repeat protein [Pirellulales bacterium]|nr:tetratricopeptide repeat protein [Pirellulales bacterium]
MHSFKAEVKSSAPRRRRWFVVGCLLLACAAGPWAWRSWRFFSHLRTARYALAALLADNAVFELNDAAALRPDSAEVQFLLGVANREAGHIDEVRTHLEQAMKLGWPKKEVRFQLTLLAFQAGDREAELELRKMLLRPLPDDTARQIYTSLTLGYLAEYRMSDAMLVLDYWVRWQPQLAYPRLLRAEIFELTQQALKQEEEYQTVLEIEPANYAAHLGLGHVLQAKHDSKHALEHFRFCHQQWSADPAAMSGIAACLKHEGRLDEAKQVLTEMLEANRLPPPQRAAALSALAEFAEQQQDLPLAVKLLAEAVALDDHNSQLHYRLGVCLAKTGRKKEAKRSTERAHELEQLAQRQSELELDLVTRPQDAELRYELGEVLQKSGYPKASAAMMLSALRWNPLHPGAHQALVKYYEELGREDLAKMHRAELGQDRRGPEESAAERATSTVAPGTAAPGTAAPGSSSVTGLIVDDANLTTDH